MRARGAGGRRRQAYQDGRLCDYEVAGKVRRVVREWRKRIGLIVGLFPPETKEEGARDETSDRHRNRRMEKRVSGNAQRLRRMPETCSSAHLLSDLSPEPRHSAGFSKCAHRCIRCTRHGPPFLSMSRFSAIVWTRHTNLEPSRVRAPGQTPTWWMGAVRETRGPIRLSRSHRVSVPTVGGKG